MYVLIFIFFGIASSMVASAKGRDSVGWFFLGLFFGPFGLIFALLVKKEGPSPGERKCPYCAEFVKEEATICRYCGKELPSEPKIDGLVDWIPADGNQNAKRQSSKICPKCNKINSSASYYCTNCGYSPSKEWTSYDQRRLEKLQEDEEVKLKNQDKIYIKFVIILFSASAIISLIIWASNGFHLTFFQP